jgi:flagellar biogenesis protein FliO
METIQMALRGSEDGSPRSPFLTLLKSLLRRVKVQRRERSLRVCESLALGEKRSLLVVAWGPRQYLVATTPQSISLLDRFDALDGESSVGGRSMPALERKFVVDSKS